jgi:hypothetical protein
MFLSTTKGGLMSTQLQAQVGAVLTALGFEGQPPDPPGVVGGPQNFKISDAALDALRGKTITIDGDGTTTIK